MPLRRPPPTLLSTRLSSTHKPAPAKPAASPPSSKRKTKAIVYTLAFASTTAVATIYGAGLRVQSEQKEAQEKMHAPAHAERSEDEEVLKILETRRQRLVGMRREVVGKLEGLKGSGE